MDLYFFTLTANDVEDLVTAFACILLVGIVYDAIINPPKKG